MGGGIAQSILHVHDGPVFANGFSCPTDKENHALVILRGIRAIRKCERCGEVFSNSSDLLEPGVRPAEEIRRKFEQEEGRRVVIES